jgi:molybdenum-dependent DNA-binding transcriptional regulator ModE
MSRTQRSDKSQQRKKAAFLAAFAITGNISTASRAAGISRDAHYDWIRNDPDYKKRFDAAQEEAVEQLEAEARRRAEQGVRRVVTYKGEPVMVWTDDEGNVVPEAVARKDRKRYKLMPLLEHEYSDTLLIFLLKAARPTKYRERIHHTSDGSFKEEPIVLVHTAPPAKDGDAHGT